MDFQRWNNWRGIYPDELILKKENEDPSQASILDLLIKLHDRKFTTELLDKSLYLSFPFYVFPFYMYCIRYLDSNRPSKIF